ncbi:TonB-dependent receptor domain-containing protein [uncultured Stenotrophomonas sp.]|uniref:TonB-dependent receptor domain-containing protein n=1 Tax=uncultured Stenotrophomonas sp. TaxID=165438 RepID=UPI0025FED3B9|nr:TonB-dependent receptor [uncultured Stenotrophomonas sp.]
MNSAAPRHLLVTAILLVVHSAHAADERTLPTLQVQASQPSRFDSRVTVDNRQAQNRTLGGLLEHVSGVQSSAFGPNAGAPVIRSLSGNRVQILQDGQSILGMNAISGNINVPFDPLFVRSVTVNKSSDTVRYGGNAIGGSVEIDSGLISRSMEDKDQSIELVLRKGFNAADAQGFRMNFNNQRNLSTNLQVSRQRISHYDIPGNSKASICNTRLFPPTGGVNASLADSCQKEARAQQIYNKASQPYIDQGITENPDWADGDFSFYTNEPTSVWQQRIYINPTNPDYVPNTPSYTRKTINDDVTPDYHRRLGNSYSRNSQVALGSTLFFDRGYVGISIDAKDSEYGVPGFSMQNLSFGSNYAKGLPVGVVIKQERYALEALLRDPLPWFERAELRVSKLDNTSGERLGATKANDYEFESTQAELLLSHQRLGPLSGMLGLSHQSRDVTGSGSLRYLPDVDTQSNAVFLKESLDFGWAALDAGVRHERVDHELRPSRFKTARNAANTRLEDRSYRLNSYSLGAYVELGPLFAAKARYSSSQRAPEINELYASRAHYSVMTQEEGNQNLEPERAKNLELTGLFHISGFELSATAYRMKYENYLYLGYSGMQTANRLPLKYWKQTNTTVKGFEIDASQALDLGRYGTLNVSAFADLVRNKSDNDDKYPPNMPTNRYGASVRWERDSWKCRLSSIYYGEQKYLGRSYIEEVPLDAFNLVDLQVSHELPTHNAYVSSVELFINGSNLLNEEARPHNSPLKYIAPLPGRGFQVGLTMKF